MRKTYLTILLASLVMVFTTGCKKKIDEQSQSAVRTEPAAEIQAPAMETAELKTAPDFALKNYDGNEVKLSDYKGKIVVLEWFNYECPFCKYHYDNSTTMVDMAKKYSDQGVVWLAINSTAHQTTELNQQFAQAHNIVFPILDDRNGEVGHKYGAATTPNMFIINKEGKIVYEGAIDNYPLGMITKIGDQEINYVANALDELLAGREISISKTKPYGCSVKYAE